jgi:hypothetical protein
MPGLVREMTISSIGTIASGLPIAATFFKADGIISGPLTPGDAGR